MLQRGARGPTVIFEYHDITKARIVSKVVQTVAEGLENLDHSVRRQVCEGFIVVGTFNNDFMGADAVHFVVDPNALLIEISFYDQSGVFIRHHPDFPARGIWWLGRIAPID